MNHYAAYRRLALRRSERGVLRVVIDAPRHNVIDQPTHEELARIWDDADQDPEVRAILVTGSGEHFSAGGDLDWVKKMASDHHARIEGMREARDLVNNIVGCSKPIVSAVRGVAVGAGLAVALLADISVVAQDARLIDGHTRLGVAAGDHAALVWPLLCGLAKAKYYLLTSETLTGEAAERIGLASLAVPDGEVMSRAEAIADLLADGSTTAVRWTKHALNAWLRTAAPHFDAALALEFLGFAGPDVHTGIDAVRQRRTPDFRRPPHADPTAEPAATGH